MARPSSRNPNLGLPTQKHCRGRIFVIPFLQAQSNLFYILLPHQESRFVSQIRPLSFLLESRLYAVLPRHERPNPSCSGVFQQSPEHIPRPFVEAWKIRPVPTCRTSTSHLSARNAEVMYCVAASLNLEHRQQAEFSFVPPACNHI